MCRHFGSSQHGGNSAILSYSLEPIHYTMPKDATQTSCNAQDTPWVISSLTWETHSKAVEETWKPHEKTGRRKQVGVKSCWPPFSPQYLQSFCSPSPDPYYTDSQAFPTWSSTPPFFTSWSSFKRCLSLHSQNVERSYTSIAPKVSVKYWYGYKKKLQLLEVHSLTIYQLCLAIQTVQGHFNSPIALN